jgi:hypothetical protein
LYKVTGAGEEGEAGSRNQWRIERMMRREQ